ncbi:MAG: RHS repeat-associated core domain-containing protein [Chloroflexi bacterium]|nr:RHS repeat-associated core domain-containing protein [Chloroflexota bacterium]
MPSYSLHEDGPFGSGNYAEKTVTLPAPVESLANTVTSVTFTAWTSSGTGSAQVQALGTTAANRNFMVSAYPQTLSATYVGKEALDALSVRVSGSGINIKISGITVNYTRTNQISAHTSHVGVANKDGAADSQSTPCSVSLQHGEKRETVVDIAMDTAYRPLTLTRYYRQFFQDRLNYMGLGWSHNHNVKLTTPSSGVVQIQFGDGGVITLRETATGGQYYRGDPGLQAELFWNSPPVAGISYILTHVDGSKYYFDISKLIKIDFPDGTEWTYTYQSDSGQHDFGLLRKVEDNHGKQLNFRYYDNSGNFKHKKLWRVGDHGAAGLAGTSPTGRYVEFSYTKQPVTDKPLLTSVRDLNGQTWTYEYSDNVDYKGTTLSPLFKVETPHVAASSTGYDSTKGIVIKRLEYGWTGSGSNKRIASVNQKLGKEGSSENYQREEQYTFNNDGLYYDTYVSVAGKTTQHKYELGAYVGAFDANGKSVKQTLDGHYRPISVSDGNDNVTSLSWTSSGDFLANVQDAENAITDYEYENGSSVTGRLTKTTDAVGRETIYVYDPSNSSRLPNIIRRKQNGVIFSEIHRIYHANFDKVEHELEFDPAAIPSEGLGWKSNPDNHTSPAPIRRVDYTYIGSGYNTQMLASIVNVDLVGADDQSTSYTYDNYGRVIKTVRSSLFGSCLVSETYYDDAGNVTATVCGHSSLDLGTTYAQLDSVYDPNDPDKHRVTKYAYDPLGRRIEERTDVGSPFEQKHYTAYDALDRVTRTIRNVKPSTTSWLDAAQWVWDATQSRWETATGTAISHGTRNDENLIEDFEYNELGQIRLKRDTLGNVTLYGYDNVARVDKVIESVSKPNFFITGNSVEDPPEEPAPTLQERLTLSSYLASADPDKDIITKLKYDGAGNRISLRRFTDTDPIETTIDTTYDKMNRVLTETVNLAEGADKALPDQHVRTRYEYDGVGRRIVHEQMVENRPYSATENTNVWRTTLFGYSSRNEQVRSYASASDRLYFDTVTTDPTLANYVESGLPDQDLLTRRWYEEHSWVSSERDAIGNRTWYRYDGLGRVIKKIVNAVGTATDMSANDPRSDSYVPSSAPDQDIITRTYYNADGRPQRVQQLLDTANPNAHWTLYDYDAGGRVKRVIKNASRADYYGTDAWSDLSGYTPATFSADSDKDLASTYTYDGKGRLIQVLDERSDNVTYTVYDQLDRTVMTVQNYVASGSTTPAAWVWSAANSRWENGSGAAIDHGTRKDQNLIAQTAYDRLGRVTSVRDATGALRVHELDRLGRTVKVIENYVDGVYSSSQPDEDRITVNVYDKAGNLLSVTDPRGVVTKYEYDKLGRAVQTIAGYGSGFATTTYTCYNKAGEVLRTIANYVPGGNPVQDEWVSQGVWLFNPTDHGTDNDVNLITAFGYDRAGRQTSVVNPAGDTVQYAYDKAGRMLTETDPLGAEKALRYDALGRPILAVENYIPMSPDMPDPQPWIWSSANSRWEDGSGTAIVHGTALDANVIGAMSYDKAGNLLSRRDPRGNLTTYEYDRLNRRTKATDPAGEQWTTAYGLPSGSTGITAVVNAYPGLNAANTAYSVTRETDRSGRLIGIDYGDPASTPKVELAYNLAGRRTSVIERTTGGTILRKTDYTYDKAQRLKTAVFDTNDDGTPDTTVTYVYDGGGYLTQMLPGIVSGSIDYTYDGKGRIAGINDVNGQSSSFLYTNVDRLSVARWNAGTGRDEQLFKSEMAYDPAGRVTTIHHHRLIWGNTQETLARFDYTVDARGNRTQAVEQRQPSGGGSLQPQTHVYTYDGVERVTGATTYPNATPTGTPIRTFAYAYDLAGNRTSAALNGTPTNYSYNNRNQLTSDGTHTFGYDKNGNRISDGTLSTIWDRAGRMLSHDGHGYAYDGEGRRIAQTAGGSTTRYVLDVQRGLPAVIGAKTGSDVTHYMHGPLGMFAQRNPDSSWDWMLHDGLGSVRGVFDGTLQSAAEYDPFGEPIVAPVGTAYGFTGELTDGNGLVYLRARYLAPGLGTFASRDPWRGTASAPRTWNGYAWVEGNVVNRVDPGGMQSIGFAPYSGSEPDVVYTVNTASGGSSCGNQSSVPVRTKESKLAERVSQGFARTRGTFVPFQDPGKLPSREQCPMSALYSYGPCKDFSVFDMVGGGSVSGGVFDDVIGDVINVIRVAFGAFEAAEASSEQDRSSAQESAVERIARVQISQVAPEERNDCGEYESPEWEAEKNRRKALQDAACGDALESCRQQNLVKLRDSSGNVLEASVMEWAQRYITCGERRRDVDKCYPEPDEGHMDAIRDLNGGLEICYNAIDLIRNKKDPTKAKSWKELLR